MYIQSYSASKHRMSQLVPRNRNPISCRLGTCEAYLWHYNHSTPRNLSWLVCYPGGLPMKGHLDWQDLQTLPVDILEAAFHGVGHPYTDAKSCLLPLTHDKRSTVKLSTCLGVWAHYRIINTGPNRGRDFFESVKSLLRERFSSARNLKWQCFIGSNRINCTCPWWGEPYS